MFNTIIVAPQNKTMGELLSNSCGIKSKTSKTTIWRCTGRKRTKGSGMLVSQTNGNFIHFFNVQPPLFLRKQASGMTVISTPCRPKKTASEYSSSMYHMYATMAQLLWLMPVPTSSSVAIYWWDGPSHVPNSKLLGVSPFFIQNLVPSSTYHMYLECDIGRSNTPQFQTRDVYLVKGIMMIWFH